MNLLIWRMILNMAYIMVFKGVVMKEDLLDCCSGLAIATATNSSYLFCRNNRPM